MSPHTHQEQMQVLCPPCGLKNNKENKDKFHSRKSLEGAEGE
jgi:hypothetical protein